MAITTTPSGGPQGEFSTYTPIYATTLSSATASITLSNIPSTFTDLVMVTNFGTSTAGPMTIQVNGDTGANYSRTCLYGDGTSAASFRETSQTYLNSANGYTTLTGLDFTHFMNYSNTSTYKTILNRNGNTSGTVALNANTWHSTLPITSIKVYCSSGYNLISGSSVTLYGIKAVGTPFVPTKASGGNYAVSDGTYGYHTFLTSGIFTPVQSLSCDILVVAGGGGGGGGTGTGGGGAGGMLEYTSQSLTATAYAVTVGAGGVGGWSATNGGNSQFAALTASVGGGRGASQGAPYAATGGSGGGGSYGGASGIQVPGSGTSGQGNAGGNGVDFGSNTVGGGGGGGKSASGQAAQGTTQAGAGGAGSTSSISGGSTTGAGHLSGGSYYFAGGGGGATVVNNGSRQAGVGGVGGGGRGGGTTTQLSGTVNTGGGGGGQNQSYSGGNDGGSGIIIVRYLL